MPLATNLQSLITRIGTEFKSIRVVTGTLSSLTTTNKTSLVSAVNEVKASVASAGAAINDTTPSTTTVYSSTKTDAQVSAAVSALVASSPATLDTLKELSDALGGDASFATTISTALGKRVRFDAAQVLTAPEKTQALANIGGQLASDIGDPNVDLVAAFNTALV